HQKTKWLGVYGRPTCNEELKCSTANALVRVQWYAYMQNMEASILLLRLGGSAPINNPGNIRNAKNRIRNRRIWNGDAWISTTKIKALLRLRSAVTLGGPQLSFEDPYSAT
ncbi:hypothetical protein Tco_1497490, partial [Tanacetum coccineum]